MKKSKRLLAAVLTVMMVLTMLPTMALADVGIAVPTDTTPAVGDIVYYGVYPQSKYTDNGGTPPGYSATPANGDIFTDTTGQKYAYSNGNSDATRHGWFVYEPIAWRVLSSSGGELFVVSKNNLDGGIPYHTTPTSVTWELSTIRSWLNDYSTGEAGASVENPYTNSFIDLAFSAEEQAAISTTSVVNDTDNDPTNGESGTPTSDKIFLLSIAEANTYFANNTARVANNSAYTASNPGLCVAGDADFWWLRSPGISVYLAAVVDDLGDVYDYGDTVRSDYVALRPAFKLNLSSVIFTSDASGASAKSSATVGSGLIPAQPAGANLKLTVLDDYNASTNPTGLSLNVPDTSARIVVQGGTVNIAYTGARTGANKYVSCVLTDTSGNVLYYGKLVDCTSANTSGTASFTLPAGLALGSYIIKIFNEEANGDNYTDFASTPVEIALTVRAPGAYPASQIAFGGKVWDVIGYDGAGVASDTDVATLLLANITGNGYGDTAFHGSSNIYSASTLKTAMDAAATAIQTNNTKEAALIVPRNLLGGSGNYGTGGYNSDHIAGSTVSDVRFWPLSVSEAIAVDTGIRAFNNVWWLRSPGFNDYIAAVVDDLGDVYSSGGGVDDDHIALRPAFNLDLSSVIFTSDASGASAKSTAAVGGGLIPAQPAGDILKLTVLDTSLAASFSATVTEPSVQQGGTVEVTYGNAETGADNYVSCIIEQSGVVKYYGKLSQNASDTVSFTLPAGLTAGSYTIKVFNEEANGDYYTDFASTPVEIPLTVTAKPGPGPGPSVNDSSISPKTAAPVRNADGGHDDLIITLTANGNTLNNLTYGGKNLLRGTDYTVNGSTITLKGAFLGTLAAGAHTIIFDMNQGNDPTLTLTISDEIQQPWENPFIDVHEDDWFYDDVKFVNQNGLFEGTSANIFSPNMPMTRGMVVTVLGRLAGIDIADHSGDSFDDVDTAQWYAPYVKWAAELGIVSGVGNNNYAPDADISRQDLAVILYNYAVKMGITLLETETAADFDDGSNIASYAAAAVTAMQKAGIISGKPGNVFDPQGIATRAEVAAMLHRFCEAV